MSALFPLPTPCEVNRVPISRPDVKAYLFCVFRFLPLYFFSLSGFLFPDPAGIWAANLQEFVNRARASPSFCVLRDWGWTTGTPALHTRREREQMSRTEDSLLGARLPPSQPQARDRSCRPDDKLPPLVAQPWGVGSTKTPNQGLFSPLFLSFLTLFLLPYKRQPPHCRERLRD